MKSIKKLLVLLCGIAVIFTTGGCGAKEKTYDAGRISALVPEGWTAVSRDKIVDPDKCIYLLKSSTQSDMGQVPAVYITYGVPGDMMMSSHDVYPEAEDLEDIDAAGYHWIRYVVTGDYGQTTLLETEGDYGLCQISVLNRLKNVEKTIALEDDDVQSIINSIVLKPEITSDWVTVEDGKLVVDLGAHDGYQWSGDVYAIDENAEAELGEITDGKTEISVGGSGLVKYHFELTNQQAQSGPYYRIGEADVACVMKDGKVVYLTAADKKMYDEPLEIGDYSYLYSFDTDQIAENLEGDFYCEEYGISLYIYRDENGLFQIRLQSDQVKWAMDDAVMNEFGDLEYTTCRRGNGEPTDDIGSITMVDDNTVILMDNYAQDDLSGVYTRIKE